MTGRPKAYSPDIAREICLRLSSGESLRSICSAEHMPSRSVVHQWVVDNHAGFSDQYAKARDMGMDELADELFEISDDGSNDWMERHNKEGESLGWMLNGEAVARSRLRVDTRKWYLSKLAPKRYGEKIDVNHGGQPGNPAKFEVSVTFVGVPK